MNSLMALKPRYATFLFGFTLILAVLVAVCFLPFSHAEGDFAGNMRDCLQTGHVPSTFLPDFYPYLGALFYKPFGAGGIVGLQAAMYFMLAACTLFTLRHVTNNKSASAAAAGIILLDPDLLSSIPKLWDTEVTVLFLAALLYLCLTLQSRGRVALLGIVWGLSLSVRPNFALLMLPFAYALWLAYGKAAPLRGALAGGLALAVLVTANTAAHGSFYLPQNGPYNLFAGANPHTQSALIHDFNAEPSIAAAMADHGYPAVDSYSLALKPVYTRYALTFIATHPLQWLWFGAVKLATLLRPDTKAHALFSGVGLLKLLTSLCVPLWLVLLTFAKPFRQVDKLFLLFVAAYVLPFLLTNTDPRFRPALDVLVLTHAAILILRKLAAGQNTESALVFGVSPERQGSSISR